MGFIYKIISPNNKIYIGKTYNVNNRIDDYRCKRYRSKKSIIIDSIKKYGWDSHMFNIIEECTDELMNEREIFWIKELKSYAYEHENGMNLTRGGDGQRHSWKNDKERVAKAKLRCGVNAPGYGKPFTDEAKRKLSEVKKIQNKLIGLKPSPYTHQRSLEVTQKPVVAYDRNGYFVGEYKSRVTAAKELNLSRKTVVDATNGLQTNAGGYIFKNKTDKYPLKIDVSGMKLYKHTRKILCFLGNKCIEYNSIEAAAKDLKYDRTCIFERAKKNDFKPNRKGMRFCYSENYDNLKITI